MFQVSWAWPPLDDWLLLLGLGWSQRGVAEEVRVRGSERRAFGCSENERGQGFANSASGTPVKANFDLWNTGGGKFIVIGRARWPLEISQEATRLPFRACVCWGLACPDGGPLAFILCSGSGYMGKGPHSSRVNRGAASWCRVPTHAC